MLAKRIRVHAIVVNAIEMIGLADSHNTPCFATD
jgi:hypothetical protein